MSLTNNQLVELRSILQQRRNRLRAETHVEALYAAGTDPGELAVAVGDPGDEALAIQLSDFNIRALEKETRDLRETETALRRIEEDRYGTCEDCSRAIPIERLQAYPWARRCTRCQARHEQTRGRGLTQNP